MFSSEITELSMTREKASARPPRIIVLIVLPIMYRHDERRQRGERNRQQNRHRRPHAAQEDQDHEAGEHQADDAFVEHGLDALP